MRHFSTLLLFLGFTTATLANNIEVSNIVLTDQDAGAEETTIQFDLSWENSWRISSGPGNYDAAWVFAKIRVGGSSWVTASLSGAGTLPTGATVDVVDGIGAFVYRSGDGSGDISFQSVQLVWDYGSNGIDPNAVVDVQVFALEMVYVPQGQFSLGTGGSGADNEIGEFYRVPHPFSFSRPPYSVTSEAAITVGTATNNLYYTTDAGEPGDQQGPIPAAFPKGYAAFYCSKYETSQAQYVAFFNTLSQSQKSALDITGTAGKNSDAEVNRNGVSWSGAGSASTSLPDVPVNYINNTIMLAYLDWAGLRPMTELEYEKAGRGPVDPVQDEYAWGTNSIYDEEYNVINLGQPNELITNPGEGTGNALYTLTLPTSGVITGPLRCGIFAASAVNANREETGGSYYGIMELSGNLYERAITVGFPEGRAFTGQHGDGDITSTGLHNVTGWPSTNRGIGYRGGSYANQAIFLRISDRTDAATELVGSNSRLGFRAVRSAN